VQIVILALLVASLAFLILGLMVSSPVWVVASLATSVVAVLAIRAARRRTEATPAQAVESPFAPTVVAEPAVAAEPAIPAEPAAVEFSGPARIDARRRTVRRQAETTPDVPTEATAVAEPVSEPIVEPTVPLVRARFGRKLVAADTDWHPEVEVAELAVEPEVVVMESGDSVGDEDEDPEDEPAAAHTTAPLPQRGADTVWVVDGRPRYHLGSCSFLSGRQPEPIPLDQAVEDGFTPCSLCGSGHGAGHELALRPRQPQVQSELDIAGLEEGI
jgi:hypothetical protein